MLVTIRSSQLNNLEGDDLTLDPFINTIDASDNNAESLNPKAFKPIIKIQKLL